jgi:hypothetical protein
MALQKNGFTPEQINAPEAFLRVTEEGQPLRPTAIRIRPVMRGEDASHYVFIDVDAKCSVDLLCDPWAARPWVTLFQLNDGLDKFWRWTFGARFAFAAGSIQQSVLSLLEQVVIFQQRRSPDNHGSPLDMAWAEKQRIETEQ